MVCQLTAKIYLCIKQTLFFLTVIKQLVCWIEGLFFHPQIILFMGRTPNTCDLRCTFFFYWKDCGDGGEYGCDRLCLDFVQNHVHCVYIAVAVTLADIVI